jgi:hypothetical protein
MRVGIFGDSFTITGHTFPEQAWFRILADKLGWEIIGPDSVKNTSYGLGACPTFYSYNLFLENYKKFDYVFFVASDYAKYTQPVVVNGESHYTGGITNLEYYESLAISLTTKQQLAMIKDWYIVSDTNFMVVAQELILKDIEEKMDGKILMLPCTLTSFVPERFNKLNIASNFSMWEVVLSVLQIYKYPQGLDIFSKFNESKYITNHLSYEMNLAIANMLYNHIVNGLTIEVPKNIMHNYPLSHYYIGKDE